MLLSALLLALSPASDPVARHVVAGPEDILSGVVGLPALADLASASRAAWFDVEVVRDADGVRRAELLVPVEAGSLSLALVAADLAGWNTRISIPDDGYRSLESLAVVAGGELRSELLTAPFEGASITRLDLPATDAGFAHVRFELDDTALTERVLFVARGSSDIELVTHPTSLVWRADKRIAIRAALEGGATLERATMRVSVEGGEWTSKMFDDGFHDDGFEGDGIFGAFVRPGLDARAQIRIEGFGHAFDGQPVQRTTEQRLPLFYAARDLTGGARLALSGGDLAVHLGTEGALARVHVSAELWGTTGTGKLAPAAWVSRIGEPNVQGTFELRLDPAWLAAANLDAPYELRNVRIQDPNTHALLDFEARLELPVADLALVAAAVRRAPLTPPAPMGAASGQLQAQQYERGLVLSHGYCSGGAWPAGQFSEPKLVFQDFDQNRSHDEFALLLASQASGFDSFGVVGHSQGGQAALHLLTYYESGLDDAIGGRRIQSVGSPYQGTPLAPLGGIIPGVGCGANDDMGPSGAALWLSGIPSWARAEVHYWTTSETSFGPCNFFASLILSGEEDGTTERSGGQLPGAVNEGHDYGWCHTTGMSQPAQYTDAARNAEMDAAAAR